MHADDVVAAGDEAFGTDRLVTLGAEETLLMPRTPLVLVLPHRRLEGLSTAVTARRKLLVKAIRAEYCLFLRREGSVGQRGLTLHAHETSFMPVAVLEGEVLRRMRNSKTPS